MASKVPLPVRLGGREWSFTLLPASDMPGAAGRCYYDSMQLAIANDQSPIDLVDTVLHELFHAILYAQGREYAGKVEETYVRALATGLTAALADNPHLLKWLKAKLPHEPQRQP